MVIVVIATQIEFVLFQKSQHKLVTEVKMISREEVAFQRQLLMCAVILYMLLQIKYKFTLVWKCGSLEIIRCVATSRMSSRFMSLLWKRKRLLQSMKGALAWYGKLTWESAHAWILKLLCYLIVWGITLIFMVRLSFYAIPLLIYDVMNDTL